MKPTRILFCGMRWDYGDPSRGPSHEYTNLYDSLRHMDGVSTELFDFKQAHRAGGTEFVRSRLLEAVTGFDPDLVFMVLFEDEVPRDVLFELRDRPRPVTFNWFCDDHWRFESFTKRYAPMFNACSTTASSALPKYAAMGYDRVVKTQWACNPHLYRPVPSTSQHEVTFVGQPHGDRPAILAALSAAGLPVRAWGYGWPAGRLSQEEMIEVFSNSRINLNLSNASVSGGRVRRAMARAGFGGRLRQQIKGRNFEIPGCGGFQLSGSADDLERYYEPDREIVLYKNMEELIERCRRWLGDEPGRQRIAEAGHRRTMAEHTYAQRFARIFSEIELW